MAVEVALGTPLADALNNVVQPKLVEVGWSSEDDTSLAEYIILMLVNGKTQEQIASELAQDLLPDGEGTVEFAQWLFDQVTRLRDGQQPQSQAPGPEQSIPSQQQIPAQDAGAMQGDATMSEASSGATDPNVYAGNLHGFQSNILTVYRPTGPKSMRGGKQSGRGGRMTGNINKNMDRSGDSILHRTRGQSGINSHSRQTPRGPRGGRMNQPHMQQQLGAAVGMNGMNGMPGMQQNGMISPQQQMQFMAMMEEQARMMAQFMPGMMSPNMQGFPNGQQGGQSLSDRISAPSAPGRGRGGRGRGGRGGGKPFQNGHSKQDGDDTAMGDDKADGEPSSSMDVESSQGTSDPSNTLCRFNTKCTRTDCGFAHQSPAAPEGITVDMSDTCSYGAACKNFKCTAKHPSPAQKKMHQAEQSCKFYPNCTNPACPFTHPSMPLCRNGADCTVPHCKFTHLQTVCKFNPCLNPKCAFKHAEGQKKSTVWTADGAAQQEGEHVSERKFVDDSAAEELIRPDDAENQEGIVT